MVQAISYNNIITHMAQLIGSFPHQKTMRLLLSIG